MPPTVECSPGRAADQPLMPRKAKAPEHTVPRGSAAIGSLTGRGRVAEVRMMCSQAGTSGPEGSRASRRQRRNRGRSGSGRPRDRNGSSMPTPWREGGTTYSTAGTVAHARPEA